MIEENLTSSPSSFPVLQGSLTSKNPNRFRSQTNVKPRPALNVLTSLHAPNLDDKLSLKKVMSGLPSNDSVLTSNTFPDVLTGITRRSKTPSSHPIKIFTYSSALDGSKEEAGGLLALTSVPYYKTDTGLLSEEGPNLLPQLTVSTIGKKDYKKMNSSFVKPINGNKSKLFKDKHVKTLSLDKVNIKELLKEVQGPLEKPSKIMEQEVKRYIDKIRALDQADIRRMKSGKDSENRMETAIASKEYAYRVMGLTVEEREKIRALDVNDEDFFKKIETLLVESLKRIERIERLSQDVELHEGRWVNIEADRLEWRYCYVDVRGKNPPLKISVRTQMEVKGLRILISRRHKKPAKLNCDQEFENKKVVRIYEEDRRAVAFEAPFIYIAISPDESGVMSINIEFGNVESERMFVDRGRVTTRNQAPKLVLSQTEEEDFSKEFRDIKRYFKLKQLKVAGGVDKVELNKDLDQYTPERVNQKREERKFKLVDMIRATIEKKAIIEEQKKERKAALVIRTDVQKALRGIIAENERKKIRHAILQKDWVICIGLFRVLGEIIRGVKEYKKADLEKQKQALVATTLVQKVRKRQKSKGEDIEERLVLDIRLALQFHCSLLKKEDPTIIAADEQLLMKFFLDLKTVITIQHKFSTVIETVKKVQNAWREYARKKEGFKDLLSLLWAKNYENVFQSVLMGEYHHPAFVKIPDPRSVFKKLNPHELKEDEFAKKRFINGYLKDSLERYYKNYSQYEDYMAHISKNDKKKLDIIEFLKAIPNMKNSSSARDGYKGSRAMTRTRLSILAEIEHNSNNEQVGSEGNSVLVQLHPPKLFVLPNAEELKEYIAKVIISQAISTLRRGTVAMIPGKLV